MALRLGTLRWSKYSIRPVGKKHGDKTFFSPVFKAEVLPGVQSLLPKNRSAVVKSADLENQTQVDCLVKEYKYYKKPSIELSRNFRKLCDINSDPIGWTARKPFYLAFKWIDTTLADINFEVQLKDPILVANIVKVCLEKLEKEYLVFHICPSLLESSIAIPKAEQTWNLRIFLYLALTGCLKFKLET